MLIGAHMDSVYTGVQSAMGSFFGLASILWTLAIADSVRCILLARDLTLESRHEVRLHGFAWGCSLLAFVLVVCAGVAGPAGISCWIRNTATGTVVRMITFYIPLWCGIGYSMWVYWNVSGMMSCLLERHQVEASHEYEGNAFDYRQHIEQQRRSLQCLLILPGVLVFCWTPSTIRRVIDIFIPGFAWTPLDYACVVAGPLQGALNAIIYGATPAVRDAMFGRLDHSAHKLRGNLRMLRSLRKNRGSCGRSRRSFQRLDEEDGLASGLRESANVGRPRAMSGPLPSRVSAAATAADSPAAPPAAAPALEPNILGQPSGHDRGHDRGCSGLGAGGDEERSISGGSSSVSSPRQPSPRGERRISDDWIGAGSRAEALPRVMVSSHAREEIPPCRRAPAHSSSLESDSADCADVDEDDDISPDAKAARYENLSEGDSGILASGSHGHSGSSFDLGPPWRYGGGSTGAQDEGGPAV